MTSSAETPTMRHFIVGARPVRLVPPADELDQAVAPIRERLP